jgi:hypothetical protein
LRIKEVDVKTWFVILHLGTVGVAVPVSSDIVSSDMVRCQQIMRQAYDDRLKAVLKDPGSAIAAGDVDFDCVTSHTRPKRGEVLK